MQRLVRSRRTSLRRDCSAKTGPAFLPSMLCRTLKRSTHPCLEDVVMMSKTLHPSLTSEPHLLDVIDDEWMQDVLADDCEAAAHYRTLY